MSDEYRLVPGPIPTTKRATVYAQILQDFLAGKAQTARVEMRRKPTTLYIGLNNARKTDDRFASITVHQRGGEIWLKRA
ncbi:MAG: hypothetical protein C0418_00960 [Coriobacteriaceae bacterium]|nr:hypothetical protein [Coriobacteriaceae bacterium]